MTSQTQEFFETLLKDKWKEYEPRNSQIQMALEIEKNLAEGLVSVLEAGTGVGKSLAYLVASAYFSLASEELVVITTETKNLQDQILQKDVPLLKEILGEELRVEKALGASNYFCKRKFQAAKEKDQLAPFPKSTVAELEDWLSTTKTGIRSEFAGTIREDLWTIVGRQGEECLGKYCKNFSHSFYFLEKEKWKNANILVVNHYLLAAHFASGGGILPPFSRLIVDEAHSFPEILGSSFAQFVLFDEFKELLSSLATKEKKNAIGNKLKPKEWERVQTLSEASLEKLPKFYEKLLSELPMMVEKPTRSIGPLKIDSGELETSLFELRDELGYLLDKYKKDSDDGTEQEIALELEKSKTRIEEKAIFLEGFRTKEDKNMVYWFDPITNDAKSRYYTLHSEPKSIRDFLEKEFYPSLDSIVFTSATLSTGRENFSYFQNKIGTVELEKKSYPSPFPYSSHCILYVPKHISDPSLDPKKHLAGVTVEVLELINLTKGGTFVLFTSKSALEFVLSQVTSQTDYQVFSQLELGPVLALKYFLDTPNAVLFGVASFWQGVDVKGDRLRSVILTKLPFQVPTDPVLQAREEDLKKQNKNPFMEIQLPESILLVKQGFGRLIRSSADRGIVSILDPRIHSKAYGKEILASLPKTKYITVDKDLKRAYDELYS